MRVIGAEGFFVDGEGAADEGFGVGETVGGMKQCGEIVEVSGDVGVIGTKGFLIDD